MKCIIYFEMIMILMIIDGRYLQTWIVGKWITPREQRWAPRGTQFHQFVVPPILSFRRDCTYSDLAAMRLPDDVQGLGCCEVRAPLHLSSSWFGVLACMVNFCTNSITYTNACKWSKHCVVLQFDFKTWKNKYGMMIFEVLLNVNYSYINC